jgi:hypothetical protein
MDTTTAAHPAAGSRRDFEGMERVRLRAARMYEHGAVAGHLGQQGDRPAGPWGDEHVAWSWAFILEPVDGATTRLLVRMRVSYQPAAKWAPYMWLLVEPAHFVMGRRLLLGLQERAQSSLLILEVVGAGLTAPQGERCAQPDAGEAPALSR